MSVLPYANYRFLYILVIDLGLIVLANYLAFWLRYDGSIPDWAMAQFRTMLSLLLSLRVLSFLVFRVYQGLWKYTSILDLANIVGSVFTSTLVFCVVVRWGLGHSGYPRSVYVIDSILLILLLGGMRFSRRLHQELTRLRNEKSVLIYGAGDAGEMILRDMKHSAAYEYEPIGFIDDDPAKVGRRIHGVPVLGTRIDLPTIIRNKKPNEILVAMPSAKPTAIRQIVRTLEPFNISIKTLPNLRDIVTTKVSVSLIRNLSIEDLLARDPVAIDPEFARIAIIGKRVLITGAGGSIGSELCRQVVSLDPSAMILYERYENNLYTINNELIDRQTKVSIHPLIGDITDEDRFCAVMQSFKPEIIFHAAAHKHVPLMECNPCEAIKNNIMGTRTVATAAAHYGVERFVMISTDKAVNPTSVMGATKRISEFLVQDMARRSKTNFLIVRFGNVLGSNGSVVPRFLEQIRAGGPVTVTHPEVRRYFMLIPEAVQLVLQVAALGEQGSIYVLEMGEQIKLVDLARNLIRLSGFVPDEEIAIKFIGLRPGEKISEELVGSDEITEPSPLNKIRRVRPRHLPTEGELSQSLARLEQLTTLFDARRVTDEICQILPEFYARSPESVLVTGREE